MQFANLVKEQKSSLASYPLKANARRRQCLSASYTSTYLHHYYVNF